MLPLHSLKFFPCCLNASSRLDSVNTCNTSFAFVTAFVAVVASASDFVIVVASSPSTYTFISSAVISFVVSKYLSVAPNAIVTTFASVSLVTSPIKKTNVILKNVNFQYALTLWNYMQTHMEDDVKKEKKNKDYYDEGRLRKCIDESFLLDYLVLNSINNDNSSVDKNALSEKIASNMVEKIMSIDADIDEKKLKDIIEKQYSVIKYKTVVNEKQIEDTFKKYMDKYLKDVREVKL